MNGREYEAAYRNDSDTVVVIEKTPENPDPSRYQWVDYYRGWVGKYPLSDCDRVFAVNTFARYSGYRVEVVSVNDDGTVKIQYADWNGAWATTAGGFVEHNKYELFKTVPVRELHDYHEEQRDLLFQKWRERTFPRPAEETP
ncbi:hypothetical protein AB0G02_20110 [Actinosynnema sp. NPDC023658]|uniref:hypothetical protein n=1 Tax=Actinosynnema sp. NPDC023658 TaxID=3155465 RepID=UPI0033D593AF